MQEFTFHFQTVLGGGPPKPQIAGGISPPAHSHFATSLLNNNRRWQIFAPSFSKPGYGPVLC
ncbi:hypothetical protein DPMN_162524 [Dreissena polymorpha]|uniref:Uncharacterized protein n=1 Tax=Dreissena polymorpha TaxID=45954 RepID=A0A9D4IQM4_DREPO|nr:hypothetical protein DPMN_162524 [Dreissena polymorpha]